MLSKIVYQGAPGAYSDLAASFLFPEGQRQGLTSFDAALDDLARQAFDYAVIPVFNNTAGPVTTSITPMKTMDLFVVKTHWLPIRHCLIGLPGASLDDVKTVHSHWQALAQCRQTIAGLGFKEVEEYDTAGSADIILQQGDKSKAAIASSRAAEVYGLTVLNDAMNDAPDNKTLFLVLTARPEKDSRSVRDVLAEFKLLQPAKVARPSF
jgi:prephenate dehydratase